MNIEMYTNARLKLLFAFADDFDIVERSSIYIKEQFIKIEKETETIELTIK